ncbi:MAG: lipid-A-disaccharide synthase [Candidatus Acidiferrales bacterium]
MPDTSILISAGEASGDMYAARLATALRERVPVKFFGMGGPQMRAAGVEIVADYREVHVLGILEVLAKIPAIARVLGRLSREARSRKPALAILTDFPGFHLRLARKLKSQGVPSVYFICPQFWAWRPWRANLVRRRFVRGLCIFPFEQEWYRARGVAADFIGHPLVGEVRATRTRQQFAADNNLDPSRPIVAILPGSRPGEFKQHLPRILPACASVGPSRGVQFVLALAPGISANEIAPYLRSGIPIKLIEASTYDAVAAADLAIVSSGTATVETALLGTPMIVVYRVAPFTAAIARRLVRTEMFAMVNLIAGRRVVPELIQDDLTPERLAMEIARLLDFPADRDRMRHDLAEVRAKLGAAGAIDRAADIIAAMLTATSAPAANLPQAAGQPSPRSLVS